MEERPIRILAIDDDPNVLDSYEVLFGQRKSSQQSELDELAGLTAGLNSTPEASRPPPGTLPIALELDRVDSGESGFRRIQQQPYGVVLLDMRMPGGWDGMETARHIRQVDEQVRIILITAYMDYTLDQLREEIGVHFAYLQKPFDRNELVQLTLLLAKDWQREQRLIKAEQVMARAAEEAQRANKAKDDILASMSHELRTPLTSLLGNCELMAETGLDNPQTQLLSSMEVSGKSLLYLINDILDSSKIEAGMFEIDDVPYNPHKVVEELRQIFSNRAAEAGIRFEIIHQQPFTHWLLGDGRRLSQVLINLLSNAVKFTEQGGVRLTIALDRVQQQLRFAVTDDGIGMDEETRSRIFKPFEQANRDISRRFGGTGLGLHISWNLTQLMGGTIEVSSELGKGSCFEVVIPLREGEALEQQREALPPLQLAGRVLIAEDTPELQVLERRMVEGQATGVEVELANNGKVALELMQSHHYDLVLMDMQMPVMGGIEATERLRAAGNTTTIVALTANVMQKQRDQFFSAGCDDFLSKPIDRASLRAILKRYLPPAQEAVPVQEAAPGAASRPVSPPAVVDAMVDDELMELFRERSAVLRGELMEAYQKGDWETVGHTAHTIKGSGTSFGFPQLTELGRVVQSAVDQGEFERAASAVDQLQRELAAV